MSADTVCPAKNIAMIERWPWNFHSITIEKDKETAGSHNKGKSEIRMHEPWNI